MKFTIVIFSAFLFWGCFSSQSYTYKSGDIDCISSDKNEFAQMAMGYRTFLLNGDSTTFNEMRFHCVNDEMDIKRVMFDTYGRWNKVRYPDDSKYPILIWEDVELLANDIEYDVFADGIESEGISYSSVMVFDEQNLDVFSQESVVDSLSKHFMVLVKKKKGASSFYEQYWKMVDPEHWERLQRINHRGDDLLKEVKKI